MSKFKLNNEIINLIKKLNPVIILFIATFLFSKKKSAEFKISIFHKKDFTKKIKAWGPTVRKT